MTIGFRMLVTFILCISVQSYMTAQYSKEQIDQLREQLNNAEHDSSRLKLIRSLTYGQRFSNIDSSLYYADRYSELGQKLNIPEIEGEMLSLKGVIYLEIGQIPESLDYQFKALDVSENLGDSTRVGYILNRIGNVYMEMEDYDQAMRYYRQSQELFEILKDTGMIHNEMANIGHLYEIMNVPDSALYYQRIVYEGAKKDSNRLSYTHPEIMFRMGNAFRKQGNSDSALYYYKLGIKEAYYDNDWRNLTMNNLSLAQLYNDLNVSDSTKKYAREAISIGQDITFRKGVFEASQLLSELYEKEAIYDSAYYFIKLANAERENLYGTQRFMDMQAIILEKQEEQRLAEIDRIDRENRQKQLLLITGLIVFLLIASILYYNFIQKQKANSILQKTLSDLKSTQAQLIQSEKMASLGELTAGIAHEIQNPLNFVNNFSEVSSELIDELKAEMKSGDLREVDLILEDIKENLNKINHHGNRAGNIVKGMLQHSRESSGEKEETDINKLVDEYLRLAYHGFRAKDKSFNCELRTDFEETLSKIKIVPQDIGRVLLNIFTNAFQTVTEKSNSLEEYSPLVTVSTTKVKNNVLISISDNGMGMPEHVKEKIFQPFFTTKPTGQGTGLGMSLSYDIIKAHNGTIEIDSTEGEGTQFCVILPLSH